MTILLAAAAAWGLGAALAAYERHITLVAAFLLAAAAVLLEPAPAPGVAGLQVLAAWLVLGGWWLSTRRRRRWRTWRF